ncbi:MAG: hypothetical protein K2G38_04275 [Clostridia bacterium]|nr:hypothetical protein [Clostridia bacterium]
MFSCLLVSTVEVVVAIIAVIVALASTVIALIFGLSQRKFNINSVRPIPQINTGNDFGSEVYIEIANVGTGPLCIKKLRFKKNGVESNNIYALLTDVCKDIEDFNEQHNNIPDSELPEYEYMDDIDNETIGINGSERLISFKCLNEKIYNKLCASLANITMTLEYQDIYNNNYQYKPTDFKNFAKEDF